MLVSVEGEKTDPVWTIVRIPIKLRLLRVILTLKFSNLTGFTDNG